MAPAPNPADAQKMMDEAMAKLKEQAASMTPEQKAAAAAAARTQAEATAKAAGGDDATVKAAGDMAETQVKQALGI